MSSGRRERVVGILANARLEAEVPPIRQEWFEQEYESIKGGRPYVGYAYQLQPNKRSLEGRVYFNATDEEVEILVEAGYTVLENSGYRAEYMYRINSNDLFWELLRGGMELGDN